MWNLLLNCFKTTPFLKYSNKKLRNGEKKRIHIGYVELIFSKYDLFIYYYLRKHDRPKSIVAPFFLSGFSFTSIHDSQDSRERGRLSV